MVCFVSLSPGNVCYVFSGLEAFFVLHVFSEFVFSEFVACCHLLSNGSRYSLPVYNLVITVITGKAGFIKDN